MQTNKKEMYNIIGIGMAIAVVASIISGSTVFVLISSNSQPVSTEVVEFELESFLTGYKGLSENILDEINPDLVVPFGANVKITLKAGEVSPHNLVIDEFYPESEATLVSTFEGSDSVTVISFTASERGDFTYYCSIPGHFATMNGKLIIGESSHNLAPAKSVDVESIIKKPTDISSPVGVRPAQNVEFTLVTTEVTAEIEDGTTFTFWTFNSTVPGPLIRARIGDNVTIHLQNSVESTQTHSVDFHAVTDLGGGAYYTQAEPGTTKSFSFNASHEGVFIYHCASPHVPTHISKGMYGVISIEPVAGLPLVDKEFYVGQSEVYTRMQAGNEGHQEFDNDNLLNEEPSYVTFNGKAFGLTNPEFSLNTTVNDDIRIFFGVGGPNIASNFHIIGEVFDKVYYENSQEPNMKDAETIVVAPGSALSIQMTVEKIGKFILVDHALSRAFDKGCMGFLYVNA